MTTAADVELLPEAAQQGIGRARLLWRPGDSLLDRLRSLPLEEQNAFIDQAPIEVVALIASADWAVAARPAQEWPDGDWFGWFTLAGRGGGKTRTGSESVKRRIDELAPHVSNGPDGAVRIGLVSPTHREVRDTMIQGESGLHRVLPPSMLLGGSWEDSYNKTEQRIELEGGHLIQGYSSEKPRALRGPQHHMMWMDEPAEFKDAHLGYSDEEDTTFDMAVLTLRLPPDPRLVVTGTPKNVKLIRDMLDDPDFVVTRWSSYDNAHNLAPQARRRIFGRYENTRLGRQELHAEVLEGTGTMFMAGWWNWVDSIAELPNPRGWKWVRYWDLAATEPSDSTPDPDYTAGALIGVHPADRNYCLAHIERFRKGPGPRDDRIRETARADGTAVRVWIEQEKAQAGKSTVASINRHLDGLGVSVKGDPVSGGKAIDAKTAREGRASEAKVMRAEITAGVAQQGRFYVVRGPWRLDFRDEFDEFPNGTHFDQVDAVSGGVKVLGETHEGRAGSSSTLGERSVEDVVKRAAARSQRRSRGASSVTIAR